VSYFFTDHFRTTLVGDQNIMNGVKVRLVLFRFAPSMGTPTPSWTAARTVAELTAQTGWVEATNVSGYPLTLQLDVGTRVLGGSRYVIFSEYPFSGLTETAEVRAIGVVFVGTLNGVTNPLIFVTNTPIGDVANLSPKDALTASPDTTFPDATNRWLFGWGTTTPDPLEGPLVLSRGSPDFEVSGSQHAWLYPQRANMIANPSFEKPGTDFWSGNSALSRVSVAREPAYLTPSVGEVTTPDPGPLPNQHTFVYRVRGPMTGLSATGVVAGQMKVFGQWSWLAQRSVAPNAYVVFSAYPNGNLVNVASLAANAGAVTGGDDYGAISVTLNNGSSLAVMTGWSSPDGSTWTSHPPASSAVLAPFDGNDPVAIGVCQADANATFQGRIYSVELRTGLDPKGGTVIWRFDASDYPGTGTTYQDPRGRTWTLTSDKAITPAADPSWAGQCSGTDGYAIMESNIFPTQMGELDAEQWTVQLLARGSGRLKVGFVFWDADYRVTACDWGQDEEWVLNPDTWIHVATHRHAPEGHIAMLRLEVEGGGLTIDKVLTERGYLKDWLYFDGDERYGARDDFSWYGGTNRQGASYSLWYNHRKAVTGRLFARTVDPNDPESNVTDEDMEEQGLVYRWVPAGITVVPHLDIFYPWDVQNPLPPKAAGVLPRYSESTPDGVSNPW
jgi:hypothetical protein